ncbi:MAG: hypothetical protein QNJ44_21230 [Rhodobacter sp.]|nr:hypothetical protein [Rhodobacter sp.]
MVKRILYLHCGPAKTGTSAIQAYFRDVAPAGLLYPATGQWSDGAHHQLIFSLKGLARRGEVDIPPLDGLAAALEAELNGSDGDALISSEALDPGSGLPALLDHFAPLIARRFDQVVPIVVLRHPLERAASCYNQDVKDPVTAEARLPDAYLRVRTRSFLTMPLVRAWRRAFPGTVFLSYHPAETLVPRFLGLVGHHAPEPLAPSRRNPSIGGYALAGLLAANRCLKKPELAQALFERMRRERRRQLWEGNAFPFSAEACLQAMAQHIRPDLETLAARTKIDLRGLHARPPERFTLDPRDAERLRDHIRAVAPAGTGMGGVDTLLAGFAPAHSDTS